MQLPSSLFAAAWSSSKVYPIKACQSLSPIQNEAAAGSIFTVVPAGENPAALVVGKMAGLREGICADDGGGCHSHNAEKANHLEYKVFC